MKKEKAESMFYEELSKIKYELVGTLTDLKLHSSIQVGLECVPEFRHSCR